MPGSSPCAFFSISHNVFSIEIQISIANYTCVCGRIKSKGEIQCNTQRRRRKKSKIILHIMCEWMSERARGRESVGLRTCNQNRANSRMYMNVCGWRILVNWKLLLNYSTWIMECKNEIFCSCCCCCRSCCRCYAIVIIICVIFLFHISLYISRVVYFFLSLSPLLAFALALFYLVKMLLCISARWKFTCSKLTCWNFFVAIVAFVVPNPTTFI